MELERAGRQYQLNCYDGDRYVVVTISDYGIAVLPTKTSPYTWEWWPRVPSVRHRPAL